MRILNRSLPVFIRSSSLCCVARQTCRIIGNEKNNNIIFEKCGTSADFAGHLMKMRDCPSECGTVDTYAHRIKHQVHPRHRIKHQVRPTNYHAFRPTLTLTRPRTEISRMAINVTHLLYAWNILDVLEIFTQFSIYNRLLDMIKILDQNAWTIGKSSVNVQFVGPI